MKIHERFSINISKFTKDDSFELVNDFRRVFSDPMNMDTPRTKREISDFAKSLPNAAIALVSLFPVLKQFMSNSHFKLFTQQQRL